MATLTPKIYFPNLNGLRFIAAFLVVIHHIEQFKGLLGLENFFSNPFVNLIGKLGVILFFVLSGFLITYLLLIEEKVTQTISVKNFYIRRVLRIWPLYYLIVVLSFFILPYIPFFDIENWTFAIFENLTFKLLLFMFFLPNLALILFKAVPFASQSWSVGVEEQFYIIWPVLMKKNKNKKLLLFSVICIYLLIKFGFIIYLKIFEENILVGNIYSFVSGFSIDVMAIGGILALFLFENNYFLKYLYSKYLQFTVYLILILLMGFGVRIPYFHYEIYGILFGVIIINLAANRNTILNLENRIFNYLGKISYGLYMYHPIGIVIALKSLLFFNIEGVIFQYLFSFGLTILLAGLSYKYYESYFIKKKKNFTKIISGDSVMLNKSKS